MISSEELFKSTELDVIAPREVYDIPDEIDEDWLQSVAAEDGQRGVVYFDERLVFFFYVKIPPVNDEPSASSSNKPPRELANFLLHLQITLDAKYIPSNQKQRQTVRNAGLSLQLPPRSQSHTKPTTPHAGPSIFPPNTPNPTPISAEADRSYVRTASTEGTILESYVWGDTARDEPPGRNFALFWSASRKRWIAIYRMTLGIPFLRTTFPDPLLSLTASTTLREKALAITPDRKTLLDTLRLGDKQSPHLDVSNTTVHGDSYEPPNGQLHGLQEVDILKGLNVGRNQFLENYESTLGFPTSRFSSSFRRAAFSLPPATPMVHSLTTISPAVATNTQSTTPILRKSFLKVLHTFSGFQIRMKSVSVPYVIIPETQENEEERRAAGAEERTIVLSVELTYGDATHNTTEDADPTRKSSGFAIENVEVSVGGEGATSYLLPWDRDGTQNWKPTFPLFIGPADQYNLLYAIRFWRQSDADDIADTLRLDASGGGNGDASHSAVQSNFQRPVAIIVYGRPFDIISSSPSSSSHLNNIKNANNTYNYNNLNGHVDVTLAEKHLHVRYNAQTFRSRWNCILDLTNQPDPVPDHHSPQDILPTPATPFPAVESFAKRLLERTGRPSLDKRHTIGDAALSSPRPLMISSQPHRNSTSVLTSVHIQSPSNEVKLNGRTTTPPSAFVKKHSRIPSTTAITNIPSLPNSPTSPENDYPSMTPAYPSFPSNVFPDASLAAQSPITNFRATTSHFVESRREGGLTTLVTPQTYAPVKDNFAANGNNLPIIVSVGLSRSGGSGSNGFSDTIYPFHLFSLEIFVFNRGERTRRLEISHYGNGRRRRHSLMPMRFDVSKDLDLNEPVGLIPLENRIRVGPLRPHTCQSVTMQFMALRVGVHSISPLTLTDVETGYSKNLKSVMDIVVHEPVVSSRLLDSVRH